jgi:hypothetical protein
MAIQTTTHVDPDTVETLSALCEATHGRPDPVAHSTIAACSSLPLETIRQQVSHLVAARYARRGPAGIGVTVTAAGLNAARLL